VHRRAFLATAGAATLAACTDPANDTAGAGTSEPHEPTAGTDTPARETAASQVATSAAPPKPRWAPYLASAGAPPFENGVASGDPGSDEVTLWTRVTGSSEPDVAVGWEVATTDDFTDLVAAGSTTAHVDDNHSIRVRVMGLPPGPLFYRFGIEESSSPVGRTRTAATSHDAPLRIALFSCQHYEEGWFVAHRAAVQDAPDLVVHVGDYIYGRWGVGTTVRSQPLARPRDLADYRALYDTYRSDPDLQQLHAAAPFVAVWDDNEIRSDLAGTVPDPRDAPAKRAWWESQPTSLEPPAGDGTLPIHRAVDFGVARVWLLDGRQYRSPHVCEDLEDIPGVDRCAAVDDEARTMLGAEQEAWLDNGVADDGAWDLVAQATVVADLSVTLGGLTGINNDQWDGYAAARRRLLSSIGRTPRSVILSGDIHAAMVNVLTGPDGETIPEFVTPGATSRMDSGLAAGLRLAFGLRTAIRTFEPDVQGYVLLDVEPQQVRATLRTVDPLDPASTPSTLGQWVVTPDARRPQHI